MGEYGIYLPHFPYTYEFCPWISVPDFKIDKDASNDYLCDSFTVYTAVSVNEIEENLNISIYPNPASAQLNIRINGRSNSKAIFRIYNAIGKIELSGELRQEENQIDISLL